MRIRSTFVVLALLALGGCASHPGPPPAGTHWSGESLYNEQGEEVASLACDEFSLGHAQVCDFGSHRCKYFEHCSQAYRWLMDERKPK